MSVVIKAIQESELNEVLEFIQKTSRPFFTKKIFQWQYSNPRSKLFIVEREGKIQGTQGMIFHEIIDYKHSRIISSSKSETTYVSNELRGSGAFEGLYADSMLSTVNDNQEFVWGFTALGKVWKNKLGFHVDESIIYESQLIVSIKKIKLNSIRDIIVLLHSILKNLQTQFSKLIYKSDLQIKIKSVEDIEEYLSKFKFENENIKLNYSNEFLNWRIARHPTIKYKLSSISILGIDEGYLLYHIQNHIMYISDFYSTDFSYIFEILKQSIPIARENRVHSIRFFGNINHDLNKSIFNSFKKLGGSIAKNKDMSFVVNANFPQGAEQYKNLQNWRLNGLWTEGFTY